MSQAGYSSINYNITDVEKILQFLKTQLMLQRKSEA